MEYFYSSLLDRYVTEKPDWMSSNGTYPITPQDYLSLLKAWVNDYVNKESASEEIKDAERALSISFENLLHYKYFLWRLDYDLSKVEMYWFKAYHIAKIFKKMEDFSWMYVTPDKFVNYNNEFRRSNNHMKNLRFWTISKNWEVLYYTYLFNWKLIRHKNHLYFEHLASNDIRHFGSTIILK